MPAEAIVEVVKVIGPIITTVLVPYMAWRLRQVEKNTNSKMDTVIELTRVQAEQKGKSDEQDAQRVRDDQSHSEPSRR